MASLKNMMNVQVKLEPLPQSIVQAQGPINLSTGGLGPPLLPLNHPRPADNGKKGRLKKGPADPAPRGAGQDPFKMEINQGPVLAIPPIPVMGTVPNGIPGVLPVRKKRDRFNGLTEEEVLKRKLPDHLAHGLDILIVGINPGLTAAFCGHHYSGPGNHFWKCLYLSGLILEPMKAVEDFKLLDHGIGFTNIVERTSRCSADLTKKEIQEGGILLKEKMRKYKPRIAVFNGKGIFEIFIGHKNFYLGKQPSHFPDCEGTLMFVMPSSSARCSQLPRAVDKVPFYAALKKLRDHLRGDIAQLDDSDVTFQGLELKTAVKADSKQDPGAEDMASAKKPKRQKESPSMDLGAVHQHMIRQAVKTVKMKDGFMPHGLGSAGGGGGPMGGLYPHTLSHHQHHNQQQQQQQKFPQYQQPSGLSIEQSPNNGGAGQDPLKMEIKQEPNLTIPSVPGTEAKPEGIPGAMPVKKKRDRFKGMTEEEVLMRILPDHLSPGLDIVIIGINPGLTAAYVGHYFAGPGNHFWKCLYLSGLIPEPMRALDDTKLKDFGIGFTNMVERTSRGSADLSKKEIIEGGVILREKIKKYKPRIAVFNGKGIFEVFSGQKKFSFGKQPQHFPDCKETLMYVMPSSSARCTQLPRAIDKVPFYAALKKLRDHLRGDIAKLDDNEVIFKGLELKTAVKVEPKQEPGTEACTPAKKPKRQKKAGPNLELGTMQHHLIQQAVNAVKMEDGFMPPAMGTAGDGQGPMEGMYPPIPNNQQQPPPHQSQQPEQQQQQQQQQQPPQHQHHPQTSEGQGSSGGYGLPPHPTWPGNNIMGNKPENLGPASGGNPNSQGPFYSQQPHNYGPPQPAHSHPSSMSQPQQQSGAMNPPPSLSTPWSAGAPPMPGGGPQWLPPHQDYMKHQMHASQPPPYSYQSQQHPGQQHLGQQHPGQQHPNQQHHPGQQHSGQQHPAQQHPGQQHPGAYSSSMPGSQNSNFPYSNPNFLPQMMQQKPDQNRSRDFGSLPPHSRDSGMYDQNEGKVKNEPRW